MHIEKIRVDRFGTLSDSQLESLTDGLNVFYDATETCTQTVGHFLRAILHGFDGDFRPHYLPTESRGFGGAITVQSSSGRHIISRIDDGSAGGRLTVQYPDGRVSGCRDLRDFVKISNSTYDRVFSIDFERRPAIYDLVREALSCGLELGSRYGDHKRFQEYTESLRKKRDQLAALPLVNQTLDHLQHRRRVLIEEIHSLAAQEAEQCEQGANRTRRLDSFSEETVQLDQQLKTLQDQLRSTSESIDELESQLSRRRKSLRVEEHPDRSADALHSRLYQIETRIDRWRTVLQEITQRKQTLQEDFEDHEVVSNSERHNVADPRHILRSLESHISHLQSCVGDLQVDPERYTCQCRTIRDVFGPELDEMRDDVYRLCQEQGRWERNSAQQECSSELAQLERCESELQVAIQRLAEQRQILRKQIVTHCSDDTILHKWHGEYCQCHEHPRASHDKSSREYDRDAQEEQIASWELQIDRLERRREKLIRDIDDLESKLGGLSQQRRRLDNPVGYFDTQRLADNQAELRGIERDIELTDQRRQIHQAIAALEDQIQRLQAEPPQSIILRDASEYLRRLSAGNLIQISIDENNQVSVVDEYEQCRSCEHISAGQQDQAYLSVSLALVAAFQRQGISMPLVLVGAFTNFSAHTVSEAAELIRDFAGHGHQLIVFTRFERVASVFRLLNVNVQHLPSQLSQTAAVKSVAVEQPPTPLKPADGPALSSEDSAERSWDFEEFPGELTDRVRLRREQFEYHHRDHDGQERLNPHLETVASEESTNPRAVPFAPPSAIESGEFFLTEHHSIEYVPSVDAANVERLRKIGIMIVGDLLRVLPTQAVNELRYAGITIEMIESWQAQALLVCRIPRLRPYDARVLVACGIRTPEQLVRTKPQQLRDIVRAFAASSDGQAVLMSGTEYELSRVTRWISDARAEQEDSTTPQREGSTSKRSGTAPRRRETRPDRPARYSESARGDSLSRRADGQETSRNLDEGDSDQSPIIKMDERSDLRFYLDRSADVVDAPSIGARTAERLTAVGICTVDDLLKGDADAIAAQLQNRRIKAKTIQLWQYQTALACRVPQLRGHDAQILVALDLTDPEMLAQCDPDELWEMVEPFVQSKEGKRIIRNGKQPDLDEVRDWIQWAQAARALHAA